MKNLINRFSTIISIIIVLAITGIDHNLFFIGVIVGLLLKILVFNTYFIDGVLDDFKNEIKKDLAKDLNHELKIIPLDLISKNQENLIKNNELDINLEKPTSILSSSKEEKISYNNKEVIKEKKLNFILEFFKTNTLAKIGSIIVFLGVLVILKMVFSYIGPIGKIVVGFLIGFCIYFSGFFIHKKGYEGEGKILLGLGILINYLVILAGKYILIDGENGVLLSQITSFILLILNTLFGIFTSMIYESGTLILFSFLFAFLNPILISDGTTTTPYGVCFYSLLVTFSSYFLSIKYLSTKKLSDFSKILFYSSFILGNILILISPFDTSVGFVIKILSLLIISIVGIYFSSKLKFNTAYLFIISYLFVFLNIFVGYFGSINFLNTFGVFFFIIFSIISFLFLSLSFSFSPLILGILFFFPIFILSVLVFIVGNFIFGTLGVILLLFSYLFIFSSKLVGNSFSSILRYFVWTILGIIIFGLNIKVTTSINFGYQLTTIQNILAFTSSLIFFITAYFFSRKPNNSNLYSIGTFLSILIISPLISFVLVDYVRFELTLLFVIIFTILNSIFPFINKNLIDKENIDLKQSFINLFLGQIFGFLFSLYSLVQYGNNFFSGLTTGLMIILFACFYFFLSFLVLKSLSFDLKKDLKNEEISENIKNTVLTYLFISLTLFSISIIYIFSGYDSMISFFWLVEGTLLIYFYSITKSKKIFIVANILTLFGFIYYFINIIDSNNFNNLFILGGIFTLILGQKFLENVDSKTKSFYDVISFIFISSLVFGFNSESKNNLSYIGYGKTHLLYLIIDSIIVFFISFIYLSFLNIGNVLKILWFIYLVGLGLYSLSFFPSNISYFYYDNTSKTILLNLALINSFIIFLSFFISKTFKKIGSFNNLFVYFGSFYFLIFTSIYIFKLFESTFSLTIYWGILSFILINIGLHLSLKKFRTIGLYLMFLALFKIFFNDLWTISNDILKVFAFIITGVLMIILSMLYSKKVGGDGIKGDLNFSNIFNLSKKNKENTEMSINEKLDKIEIGDKTSVVFTYFDGKKVKIRAKNLIKISILVIEKSGKTTFLPGELKNTFDYIKLNFKSDLNTRDYDKIILVMDEFVKKGGSVELI